MQYNKTIVHKTNRFSFHIFFIIILLIIPIVAQATVSSARAATGIHVDWTPGEIIDEAVPSQTIDNTLKYRFTLSNTLPIKYDVRLKLSPVLQPFISINPQIVKKIPQNQEYSTQLTISIPSGTPLGDYAGTMELFVRMHWLGLIWPNWWGRPASPKLNILLKVVSQAVNLSIKNANNYPTRIAQGPDGKFYVTDAFAGSVFIYNNNLGLAAELKGLDSPLGIAVDSQGNIFVGNNGRDNVEVYRADGMFKSKIDDGNILMPNDIALDMDKNLYVVDSQSHMVKVYDPSGLWLRNIGGSDDADGELSFPVAITISYAQASGLLYVADQGHAKVQVYDLLGNFITSYGGKIEAFSSDWQGKFTKIQSLAFDAQGRLHAADCYLNKIQILDPDTGQYLDAYGLFGTGMGQLNLPLDVFITNTGQVAVTNAGNHRVEFINTITAP